MGRLAWHALIAGDWPDVATRYVFNARALTAAEIQQLAQEFVNLATTLLTTINTTVIEISRLASVSILLIGLPLYFTRLGRRLGMDLIKGEFCWRYCLRSYFLKSIESDCIA
jgi:hypothetical protein